MSVIVEKHQKPTRIAFCGSMASGKSYSSQILASKLDLAVKSIAKPIKEIVAEIGKSDRSSHILVGMVGRHISPDYWIDHLLKRIPDEVIVDDVRFANEAKKLKENGFTLIYLDLPWYTRFKRLQRRSENYSDIEWFAHESEYSLQDFKDFDYICKSEKEVNQLIEKLL